MTGPEPALAEYLTPRHSLACSPTARRRACAALTAFWPAQSIPSARVPDLDAAIAFINERDKPLALYAFTESEQTKQRLAQETSSGGLVFGLTVAHLGACPSNRLDE